MLYRGTSFEKSVYMHVHKTSKASKPNPTLSSLRSSSGPVYISNWIDTFPIQTYRGFSIKYKKFKSKMKQLWIFEMIQASSCKQLLETIQYYGTKITSIILHNQMSFPGSFWNSNIFYINPPQNTTVKGLFYFAIDRNRIYIYYII